MIFIACEKTENLEFPVTKSILTVHNYFGQEVMDPFEWMESLNSKELKNWTETQTQLLEKFLEPVDSTTIAERIGKYLSIDRYRSPIQTKNGLLYSLFKNGKAQPEIQLEINGERQTLFNPENHLESNETFTGFIFPNADVSILALLITQGPTRWGKLKFFDLQKRELLDDEIKNVYWGRTGVAWNLDNKSLFVTQFNDPKNSSDPASFSKIIYHEIGNDKGKQQLIFDNKKPTDLYRPYVTSDSQYILVMEISQNVKTLFAKKLGTSGSFKQLHSGKNLSLIGNKGTKALLISYDAYDKGEVIQLDFKNSAKQTLISASDKLITGANQIGDLLLLNYKKDMKSTFEVYNLAGNIVSEAELPYPGTILGLINTTRQPVIHFVLNSFTDPGFIHQLDLKTGEIKKATGPDTQIVPENYMVKQVFYSSKDGTRVPMLICHKKGLSITGKNKVLVYAYGAFNSSVTPFFSARTMAWIDAGNIYAIPGVRGGGEYGKSWHESGIGINKQNGIDDYLSAVKWLIEEGYCEKGSIVANGGSASGPLVGAALVQEPALFGAALLDIPVLDMLKYHKEGNAANWTSDFGTSEKKEEFHVLNSYSPYHNISKEKQFPPVLITVGEKDATALPYHGYKFVARLQSFKHPGFLINVKGAGHSFGNTAQQRQATYTKHIRFLERVFE